MKHKIYNELSYARNILLETQDDIGSILTLENINYENWIRTFDKIIIRITLNPNKYFDIRMELKSEIEDQIFIQIDIISDIPKDQIKPISDPEDINHLRTQILAAYKYETKIGSQ